MTQQIINVGLAANDNTGDTLRNAFIKTNDNFTEIYTTQIESLRANVNLTGGGTITFNSSEYLFWNTRFIVISNGRGSHFATQGYFNIDCPTSGTITGVGGANSVTATAAGIPLGIWQALYYILPIGQGAGSVPANFRIADYAADIVIPDTWVLIALRNGDSGQGVYLPRGHRLKAGESIDTITYDAKNADLLDGQQGSYYLDWTNITNKPDPQITVSLSGDVTGSASATLTDLGNGTVSITTTVGDNSHNHTSLTGITSIGFSAQETDSASISTTIIGTQTFFDFNLTDDNNNDLWRWRFTPNGSSTYDAMKLEPVSNGVANLTVAGSVVATSSTISNNLTLSGGTANGVLYLNGSKVATSGSALTFDGSVLTLAPNQVTFGSSTILALGSGSYFKAASTNGFLVNNSADTLNFFKIDTSGNAIFYPGGSEQMRLTSTGLGIGTSSPTNKLTVNSGASTTTAQFTSTGSSVFLGLTNSGASAFIGADNTGAFLVQTPGSGYSTKLLVDSSGNLGIGTSSPAYKLDISAPNDSTARVRLLTTTGYNILWSANNSGGTWVGTEGSAGGALMSGTPAWASVITSIGANPICFGINTTERMRLDSSGNLGIGTSSPVAKLDVNGNQSFGSTSFIIGYGLNSQTGTIAGVTSPFYGLNMATFTGFSGPGIGLHGYYGLLFSTAGTERMRLDASGNLGLGVTPSAWISAYRAIDLGSTGSVYGRTDSAIEVALAANSYRNSSGNWIYRQTAIAGISGYDTTGAWYWKIAPSGTAGNAISFTQAMTLDASGNLLVGATSAGAVGVTLYPAGVIRTNTNGTVFEQYQYATSSVGTVNTDGVNIQYNAQSALVFGTNGTTERARITSGGDFGIGTTTPQYRLDVNNSGTGFQASFGSSISEGNWTGIHFGYSEAANLLYRKSAIVFERQDGSARGKIHILNNGEENATSATLTHSRVTIQHNGNVGIGTTAPDSKLVVVGGATGANVPVVRISSTQSDTFNWASSSMNSSLTAGENFIHLIGHSETGKNSGYIGYKWASSGSDSNLLTFGHYGNDNLMNLTANGNLGIGTQTPGYKLEVNGSFAATTKSFVINHPTKPGKKLRYGSLEGPENGVYVRGKLKGTNLIELPDYWTKLVDPESITVNLTPIGRHQDLYVEDIVDNKVIIRNGNLLNKEISCYYIVLAERVDVEKLEVEIG